MKSVSAASGVRSILSRRRVERILGLVHHVTSTVPMQSRCLAAFVTYEQNIQSCCCCFRDFFAAVEVGGRGGGRRVGRVGERGRRFFFWWFRRGEGAGVVFWGFCS